MPSERVLRRVVVGGAELAQRVQLRGEPRADGSAPTAGERRAAAREAGDAVLRATGGCYRDGPAPFAGDEGAVAAALDVPVDLWWWLEFFARGLACGRVRSPPVRKSNVASMAWGY